MKILYFKTKGFEKPIFLEAELFENGELLGTFSESIAPNGEDAKPERLDALGLTVDSLYSYTSMAEAVKNFKKFMNSHLAFKEKALPVSPTVEDFQRLMNLRADGIKFFPSYVVKMAKLNQNSINGLARFFGLQQKRQRAVTLKSLRENLEELLSSLKTLTKSSLPIFWFDTETTGLHPVLHDIIELYGVVEGTEEESIYFTCQPVSWENIEDSALEVHGKDRKTLKTFQPPEEAAEKLQSFLQKFDDKLIPAGMNIPFDIAMLKNFAKKTNSESLLDKIEEDYLDLQALTAVYELVRGQDLTDGKYNLDAIAKSINMDTKALRETHDAASDILITRHAFDFLAHEIDCLCSP